MANIAKLKQTQETNVGNMVQGTLFLFEGRPAIKTYTKAFGEGPGFVFLDTGEFVSTSSTGKTGNVLRKNEAFEIVAG